MLTVNIPLYGNYKACKIEDLKPGMVTIWTGGERATIMGVKWSKSGKTGQIIYANGKIDHRKMRPGRLIAVD